MSVTFCPRAFCYTHCHPKRGCSADGKFARNRIMSNQKTGTKKCTPRVWITIAYAHRWMCILSRTNFKNTWSLRPLSVAHTELPGARKAFYIQSRVLTMVGRPGNARNFGHVCNHL